MRGSGSLLIGREREVAAVEGLVANARTGSSGVLLLVGGPGVGKTALLDHAAAGAAGCTLARIAGVESEEDLGYAALQRLLIPFGDSRDRLPSRQHDALQSALGLLDGPPADRFLTCLAVLSVLADAATADPLVCIVDDAHWLDRESLDALAFVARRLHAERLAMIFASREPRSQFAGVPSLEIADLDRSAAEILLLRTVDGPLETVMVDRIIDETGGNPLAVTELGVSLSRDRDRLATITPNPLPISHRLEDHYAQQLQALPAPAQTLALVAAADASARPDIVRRAAATLGADDGAEEAVLESGLLWMEPRVEFRHPLVRSAIYAAAPSAQRRAAHAALAALVDPGAESERRAWHLASATSGPDDEVADELERSAARADAQGRYAGAAALLSRSAELSGDRATQVRRQLDAARAYLVGGGVKRANALLRAAEPAADTPMLRAHAQRLRTAINSFAVPSVIPKARLDAARTLEALDVRLARDTYAEALESCLVSGQLTVGTTPVEVARAALAAPPAPPEPDGPLLTDLMLDGFATRFAIGYEAAVPTLQRAIAELCESDLQTPSFTRWSVLGNNASADLWDVDSYISMLQRLEAFERERGALDALRITLGGLAHAEMWQGRFEVAEACHSEATEIARALGGAAEMWEMLKVELFAWQGRGEETRAVAAAMLDVQPNGPSAGVAVNLARVALTVLEQAQGHYKEALHAALPLYEYDIPPHGSQILPELVEAGARSGDHDIAMRALERLEHRATASGTAWALGLLDRSRALLAEDAEPHHRASIERLAMTPVRTDLARAYLLYGEWLRRENRRVDARDPLRTAFEMFSAMGAPHFAERARSELAATGERARRRTVETTNDLTPQEAQVARLAAEGATNREIAATMFISATTVDYHLRKAFRKLGVTSRRQLRTSLPR